MKNKEQDLH